MKTEPNEPINAALDMNSYKGTQVLELRYKGLTKREHMAIEFTKAYANSNYVANSGVPYQQIAEWGIRMADELIKQLNAE